MQRSLVSVCLLLLVAAALVSADMYLQSFPGSNDRLDEEGRERANANRLFNSQNNDRGGYNVQSYYFYEGSTVHMEWTTQHSCGNPNTQCEMIIQYMCDERLRDGTTTTTIPDDAKQCYDGECDTDTRFGRHESWDYYKLCKYTQRNKGLFAGSQRLNGNDRRFTRQQPNANRYGYECQEERDYYPWWGVSPWRDIAVLTNQPRRCAEYQRESQNVKSRFYCQLPDGFVKQQAAQGKTAFIPIERSACEAVSYISASGDAQYGKWVEFPSWGLEAPICRDNVWSRDNHLGNVGGGFPSMFNWTVPAVVHERCALRVRYNISTADLGPDGSPDTSNWLSPSSVQSSAYLNSSLNDQNGNLADMWSKFRLDRTAGIARGYQFKNNPQVDIFGTLLPSGKTVKLQLAVNTAQYGRTFQDRSHRFMMLKRPAELVGVNIFNLNVKGKRGNIVQTFPGTEYDFQPNRLTVGKNDYIHFQWSGSNTNPGNNAGQGRQGSDRSNVIPIRAAVFDEGQRATTPPTNGQFGSSYPARIDGAAGTVPFLGFSKELLVRLATSQTIGVQIGGELSELDDASPYFDLGPQQVTQPGIYHYLCSRNNNFSNRGQKAKIVVLDGSAPQIQQLGWLGGTIQQSEAKVVATEGSFSNPQVISLNLLSPDTVSSIGGVSKQIVEVQPLQLSLGDGQTVNVVIPFKRNPIGKTSVYYAETLDGPWDSVSASINGNRATVATTKGGYFAVKTKPDPGIIAGIAIGCIIGSTGIAAAAYYVYKKYRHLMPETTKSAV